MSNLPVRAFPLFVLAALFAAACLSVPPTLADDEPIEEAPALDQVHLINGSVFEGTIEKDDADGIVLVFPSGEAGGGGRMSIPRDMVAKVVRGAVTRAARGPDAPIRDAWFLLQSGGQTLGTRHLVLRRVRTEERHGWYLEEEIVHFPGGRHIPTTRIQRVENVDLAFRPVRLHFREVGEASLEPGGPPRYERMLTGRVDGETWRVLIGTGASAERGTVALPAGTRGRLGTREHLLRTREIGVNEVTFLEPSEQQLVTVRAGYSALDVFQEGGGLYDEFVWEESGVRLVSKFKDAEALEEWIAEGVVAVPCSEAQASAATEDAAASARERERGRIRLPEVGVSFEVPGTSWSVTRGQVGPVVSGWRKVASIESSFHVADVRVEWDPEGAAVAPGIVEAEARLLQRLRSVCPDLQVLEAPRALEGLDGAWRMELLGTLKEERIRTIAVVLDRGPARVLFLVACPELAWAEAQRSLEAFVSSIQRL